MFVSVENMLFYIKYGTHDLVLNYFVILRYFFWFAMTFQTWNFFVLAKFVESVGPRSQGNQFLSLKDKSNTWKLPVFSVN